MRVLVPALVGCAACGVAEAQKPPARVAVMDFTAASTSAEFEPLGAGLQSMITTDLGQVPSLVLVERARLKDIQAELHLSASGQVDKATAAKIGSLAGASHLLVGSFTVVGGRMRLDARMFAVGSGEVVLGEKMEGAQTAFFELEKQLVTKIVASVGVRLNRAQKAELQKPATTDFEAFQKYSQGLVLFDEKKTDQAAVAMQAAVTKDPSFALAATRLAEFQKLLAALPPPPKPPAETQCKPNPLFSPPCTPDVQGGPPPSVPMVFAGPDKQVALTVKTNGMEAQCLTPCQLHLPPGKVDLEVIGPTKYHEVIDVPPGPASVQVGVRNNTNLIIGSVLAAVALAATGATIGLHEAPTGTTTGSQASQYWPLTFAVATGAAFPAVLYLLKVGSNHAKVVKYTN
jgi:TolB-like protein